MTVEVSLVIETCTNQNNFNTQLTSEGFGTPDMVLFWCGDWVNEDNEIISSYQHSFGWATPTAVRCISTNSPSNTMSSVTRQMSDEYIIVTGNSDPQATWDPTFITDGVNLRALRNPGADRNYPVYALLMKGVVNTYDGAFRAIKLSGQEPASETVNCGFRPGLIISSTIATADITDMPQPVNQGAFGLGFASENGQKSVFSFSRTVEDPRECAIGRADRFSCLHTMFTGSDTGPQWTVNCDNYTDTGFDLTMEVNPAIESIDDYVYYLALDFGPDIAAQILDGVSVAGQEVQLEFNRGSVVLGIVPDALTSAASAPPQLTNGTAINNWIAYQGREASIGFSDEDGFSNNGLPKTRNGRWSTTLHGLSYDGLDAWSGTSSFTPTGPTMGFTRSALSGAYFMAVAFGTPPTTVNKLWMGDIRPDLYMGDDQVDRVYMGDEQVWQKQ